MSFLQDIQERKCGLKTTDTVVKTVSGDVFVEKKNRDGKIHIEKVAYSTGYVIDSKPDLQVAAVLPGLYMGSQDVTQDENILKAHKITYILSVGIQVRQLPGIKYFFMEALDLPEFDMNPVFDRSTKLIESILFEGGVIYVHCNAGVSRSAAVVVAYLMAHKRLQYQEAFDLLRQSRPCIKPNEGFVKQLKIYEKMLCSKVYCIK